MTSTKHLRACVPAALTLLLGLTGTGVAAPLPTIAHDEVACLRKDKFAWIEAAIQPAQAGARSRLYFTSPLEDDYYAVELTAVDDSDAFRARLPKPKSKAGVVVYFLEVLTTEGELLRTPEVRAQVVNKPKDCPASGRLASEAPKGKIDILAFTTDADRPRGFGGVKSVMPAPEILVAEAVAPPPPADVGVTQVRVPAPPPTRRQSSLEPASELPSDAPIPTQAAPPLEYALGPQDIINVVVVGHADLTQTVLIQSDGTFIFPLLGRLTGAGSTPKQLEAELTGRLARGFIRNPEVSITIQEYRSKTVMVMGAVTRPGAFPLSGTQRLMDILAKAGMTAGAGTEIQIIRPLEPTASPILPAEVTGGSGLLPPGAPQADILTVDLQAIQRGDLDRNIRLQPNDTVFVPSAAKFYVTGEARSPGAYTLVPGLTVREAVILAGGFTDDASKGRTRVIREVDGKKKERKIKLDAPVLAGDIIVVKAKLF